MTREHHYFVAESTSYTDSRRDASKTVIVWNPKPRRNGDGTTSFGLRFPVLILSEMTNNPEEIAKTIADILNENAHRFLSKEELARESGESQ